MTTITEPVVTIAAAIAANYVPFGERTAPMDDTDLHAEITRLTELNARLTELNDNQGSNIAAYMQDVARLSAEVAANNAAIMGLNMDVKRLSGLNVNQFNIITDHNETIDNLRIEVARLGRDLQLWRADVTAIGVELLDQAEARNWCKEYDDVIAKLNSDLAVAELPTREISASVYITVRIRVDLDDVSDESAAAADARQRVVDMLHADSDVADYDITASNVQID